MTQFNYLKLQNLLFARTGIWCYTYTRLDRVWGNLLVEIWSDKHGIIGTYKRPKTESEAEVIVQDVILTCLFEKP